MDAEYWWQPMYKDVHDYYKSCDACQITRRLYTQSLAKLVISLLEEPFMKRGLDFVGLIKLTKKIHGTNLFLLPQIMLPSGWKQEHWKLILQQSQQNF